MIDVCIKKSGAHYTGWYVGGHAGYAEIGKDIVCAAVSALTITLETALEVLSDVPVREKAGAGETGRRMYLPVPSDKTDLLIEFYKMGIEGLQETYPDHVRLHLET